MKFLLSYFTLCFIAYQHANKVAAAIVDPDAYRNVSELITSKGYPLEEHTVITEDGYVLSVQRIPHGRDNNTERGDKEVVLLVHGELSDGKTWFLNPPGWGLGYILPEEGYDVWVINCRGSAYSKKNIYYPTRSLQFWDFSFDEIAKGDLTAVIDYILNDTGKESLHYIGYSRGNTVGFVLLSELPEYNKKVKTLVAFAPVAYYGYFRTILRYSVPFAEGIKASVDAVTQGEFLPTNKALRIFIAKFCEVQPIGICKNVLFAIGGQDTKLTNETRVPVYTAQYLSSTSIKILYHSVQLHRSKKFRKYDYTLEDPLRNLQEYGQVKPPDYQLQRISSPVALFWSTNDKIADTTDVRILRKQLNSVVLDYKVPGNIYNHFDFLWAIDVVERVYRPLLSLLSQY